jgi:hypothetical protein
VTEKEAHDLDWDDPLVAKFQSWVLMRDEVDSLTANLNQIRDECLTAIEARGYRDHKGSQYLKLPGVIGQKGFASLKRERRATKHVDVEVAENITRSRGIYDACFPAVPTLDEEELYVQYQKGKLSAKDMDSIFTWAYSFSFRPMT